MDDDITADRRVPVESIFEPLPIGHRPPVRAQAAPANPQSALGSWRSAQNALRPYRGVAYVALLLVLTILLVQAHLRASRAQAAAETAHIDSRRAADTRDFLVSVFTAADTQIVAAGANPQPLSARQRLELATPRIEQEFADDPRAQVDMLGFVADMHRALGNAEQYRNLRQVQRQKMAQIYGEANPAVIESLMDDAALALQASAVQDAQGLLDTADPLIRKADLDRSAVRARWLLNYASLSRTAGAQQQDDAHALAQAVALLAETAPENLAYLEASNRLAQWSLSHDPQQAAQHFQSAISAPGVPHDRVRRAAVLRRVSYPGLARAREMTGDYAGALQAYVAGAELLPEFGADLADEDRMLAADYASALHRLGQRAAADALFNRLLLLEAAAPALSHSEARDRAMLLFAESRLAEGRFADALAWLDQVDAQDSSELLPRVQLARGIALQQAGDGVAAEQQLRATLETLRTADNADTAFAQTVRERWARLLLEGKAPTMAAAEFEDILLRANGRPTELAVLARGGLGRLALLKQDASLALTHSTASVVEYENLRGPRDARSGPYLWLIHARALRASGDMVSSRIWAERARAASAHYDGSEAASTHLAEVEIAALAE